MMLEIEALPAFTDNYIWLIKNQTTKQVAVVDPGDANPVLAWLEKNKGWQLSDILITHHHQDHIGGISTLKAKTSAKVFAPNNPSIPHKDIIVTDSQIIDIVGSLLRVIAVPGHTLDHVAYYASTQNNMPARLFSGDTLFSGGCGRVFEGTMEQMYHSLQQLNELPPDTLIYPAHEYTVSNLKFAIAVEPSNNLAKEYLDKCIGLRESQQITLPSTLSMEQRVNPFLRCDQASIIMTIENTLRLHPTDAKEVFSDLREWKNKF